MRYEQTRIRARHLIFKTCEKRFIQKSGYISHMRSHYNKKNAIFCPYCKKKFREQHNLKASALHRTQMTSSSFQVHVNYYHPEKVSEYELRYNSEKLKKTFSANGQTLFQLPAPLPAEEVKDVKKKPLPTYEPVTFPVRNESFREDVLPDIADYYRDQ